MLIVSIGASPSEKPTEGGVPQLPTQASGLQIRRVWRLGGLRW